MIEKAGSALSAATSITSLEKSAICVPVVPLVRSRLFRAKVPSHQNRRPRAPRPKQRAFLRMQQLLSRDGTVPVVGTTISTAGSCATCANAGSLAQITLSSATLLPPAARVVRGGTHPVSAEMTAMEAGNSAGRARSAGTSTSIRAEFATAEPAVYRVHLEPACGSARATPPTGLAGVAIAAVHLTNRVTSQQMPVSPQRWCHEPHLPHSLGDLVDGYGTKVGTKTRTTRAKAEVLRKVA
mmetsp:Transcript_40785/g.79463  ORF Transcript_40785/g.79463 Transcript_40785/m.79463 type:complete len:240 (-) Transcript_40785:969-1688(-)